MSNEIPPTAELVSDEVISLRAYQLWEARGCPQTDGADDWHAAHSQLLSEAQPTSQRRSLRKLFSRILRRQAA